MLSFFRGMTEMQRNDPNAVVRSILPPEAQIEYDLQAAAKQAKVKELGERIGKIESEFKTRLDAEKKADELRAAIAGAALPAADPAAPQPELADLMKQRGLDLLGPEEMAYYNQLKGEFAAANARVIPGGDWALAIEEVGPAPPETHILLRGNPHVPGDPAEPCFPSIIAPEAPKIPPADPGAKTAGRRRYLADWIASADNRLTARVMVNRIWQGHFGRGIVRSSNNFGLGGDPPTHPELLDWLASEFIRRGWSVKAMHRLIMTSRAYQMSSRAGAKELAADPNNDFFWRFDMRRLQAEEIRDAILAVTGDINLKVGGESVFPKMPEAVLATSSTPKLVWGNSPEEERNRRSVYIHLKRSLLTPLLAEFDLADTDSSCPVRFVTTQPTQALGLLNGEFITEEAARFAGRIRRESGDDIEGGVRRAISLVTCRDAQPAEIGEAMKFIRELEEKDGLPAEKALERFCLLALNLNEFIYLD
ncbi:DUF1553 domain-containing protein [Candidatus Sumerlaeota bacterium]|nr:DUF1553 domain-containing protein [Candidatus Sumerlaeota bacterium]